MLIPEGFWEHQKRMNHLSLAESVANYAYLAEQGTGKTPAAVNHMRNLFLRHKKALKTLILCPQVVISNWRREIAAWSKCEPYVELLTGSKKERIAKLEKPGKAIFITNFEALDMDGLFWESKGRERKRFLIERGFELLIVDECHRLKTPNAKRTKIAIRMADKIFYKLLLTGTPITNSPKDIWAQYRILDGGETFGTSFHDFQSRYFIDKNAGMPKQQYFPNWVFRPEYEKEITDKIYRKAIRVLKEECMDLPPLVMTRIATELGKDQRRCYDEMRKDYIAILKGKACTAELALTKGLRLLQIASGHFVAEDGSVQEFKDCPRLSTLESLLEDTPGKIIVWAVFKHNYAAIAKVCESLGLEHCFLTGEQNAGAKQAAVDRFTKGSARILIANPGAGGTGVNLVEAATSIWYSRDYKLENRLQAIARNHRGGSDIHAKITSYDICAQGTIDEIVLAALDSKEDMAKKLIDSADLI